MSEQIDKFCDDLKDRLNGVYQRLAQVKGKLDAATKEDEEAMRAMFEESQRGLEEKRKKHEEGRERFKARVQAKPAELKARLDEWKNERDTRALANEADDAEEYARWTVDVAASAVAESEVAILLAASARMDAENALAASKKAA